MLRQAAPAFAAVALAAVSGGCGTLVNQAAGPGQAPYGDQLPAKMPYGGVVRDLAAPPAGLWQAATAGEEAGVVGRAGMVAAAVLVPPLDLPFSAVADTLLLPFDLAHQFGWDATGSTGSRGDKGGVSGPPQAGESGGPPAAH